MEHVPHMRKCLVKPTPCMFGCMNGLTYKTVEEHLNHLGVGCQSALLECTKCSGKTTRANEKIHDCLPLLIKELMKITRDKD